MYELLIMDTWSIVIVVVSILIVFALYYFKKKKEAAKLACKLMEIAERLVVGGDAKHNFVYDYLYPVLPSILKMLYTEKQVRNFIQYWFDKSEEKLKQIVKNV